MDLHFSTAIRYRLARDYLKLTVITQVRMEFIVEVN